MLDDHVATEAEGVSRTFPAKFAAIEFGLALGFNANFQELHHAES